MIGIVTSFQPSGRESHSDPLACAIVVTPWLGTSVPWFAVGVGILLSRDGQKTTFILDDYPFGNNRLRYRFILFCLKSVLKLLASRHRVIVLSHLKPDGLLNEDMRAEVKQLAILNAVWELRGEMIDAGRQKFVDLCERQLTAAYPAIYAVTALNRYDLLFVPGGVWGTTGIWSSCALRAGIRVSSFDSGGYGTAMLAVNGVACQLQDIPYAFGLIRQGDDTARSVRLAKREAQAEMDRRRAGSDSFMSQVVGSGGGDSRYDDAILIALNSSWDSAALGLHTVFKDNTDWIVSTVRFLLENTVAAVIVRQHPAERLEIARTTDNYDLLLKQHFGVNPRLHFIAAADRINSYELMSKVKALVVYTSTIGIEAAANMKPVITPSSSYYSGLGFVYKATSLSQYQNFLINACECNLKLDEEQREGALICYYLTQCCNWVFSPFNPADYSEWSQQSLEHWYADKNVHKMVRALVGNIPMAYLNHLDRLKEDRDFYPD